MKWLEKIQIQSELAKSCWAIEIGTTTIRAAAVKKKGRGFKVFDIRKVEIPRRKPGSPAPEAVQEALARLLAKGRPRTEVVVSSLPLPRLFLRSMVLPFTSVAQINRVIASEVELHVPFSLDQVVIDFWPAEELEEGKTRVIMAAVKKELLQNHLEMLAAAGLEPARVGIDCLGLAGAFQITNLLDPAEVTLLVEIGAVHTSVAFIFQGRLIFMRSFTWGGDTVSAAIMKEVGCDFIEAERLKADPELEGHLAEQVAAAVAGSFPALETDLVQTLHSASVLTGGHAPRKLILSGETVARPDLKKLLVEKINCPILEVDPWTKVATGRLDIDSFPSALGCLGSALASIKSTRKQLDFRKGEFAFSGSWEIIKRRLWVTLSLFLLLAGVLAATGGIKVALQARRFNNLNREINSLLTTTFPEVDPVVSGDEIDEMEKALKRKKADFKYYQAFSLISAFDVLREISRIIPDDIKVQVVELDIGRKLVRFRGRTDSYRSAERIKNSFQKSAYFQADEIKEGDTKTKKVGGKLVTVEFKYTIPFVNREL